MIEDHPLHPAPWSSRARMELNRDTFSRPPHCDGYCARSYAESAIPSTS